MGHKCLPSRAHTGHARDCAGAQVRLDDADDSEAPGRWLPESSQGTVPPKKQGNGLRSLGRFHYSIILVRL